MRKESCGFVRAKNAANLRFIEVRGKVEERVESREDASGRNSCSAAAGSSFSAFNRCRLRCGSSFKASFIVSFPAVPFDNAGFVVVVGAVDSKRPAWWEKGSVLELGETFPLKKALGFEGPLYEK